MEQGLKGEESGLETKEQGLKGEEAGNKSGRSRD